ncbi:ABC transporter substrate-binding protein [Cryptosporangium sp. NPDC048952]|uniref:ABC transporter substrate-binding protein n=1 Tax=Cryptosporangium sp. NPDC048952 TaxID=3363961 RepID=UPI003710E058
MKRAASWAVACVIAIGTLSACANPTTGSQQQAGAADIVGSVKKDEAIAALVPERIKNQGHFTVSINPDVTPIKFVDDEGKIAGLNPDLLRAAGKIMGVEVRFQQGTFDAMVPGLESKRYDAIASIADFVERQTKIDFIDYLQNGTAVIAAKGFEQDSVTREKMCGLSVGYARGTSQQGSLETISRDCVARRLPELKINGYQDSAAGILSVKSGEADAFWGDLPQMAYNTQTSPELFKIIFQEKGSVVGIGIRKDDPQLRDALRGALLKLVDDGVYEALLKQWKLVGFGIPEMPVNSKNSLAKR